MIQNFSDTSRFSSGKYLGFYNLRAAMLAAVNVRLMAIEALPTEVEHTGLAHDILRRVRPSSFDQLPLMLQGLAATMSEASRTINALIDIKRSDILMRPVEVLPIIRNEIETRIPNLALRKAIDLDLVVNMLGMTAAPAEEFVLVRRRTDGYLATFRELFEDAKSKINMISPTQLPSMMAYIRIADVLLAITHTPAIAASLAGPSGVLGSAEARNRGRAVAARELAMLFEVLSLQPLFASAAVLDYVESTINNWYNGLPSLYAGKDDPIARFIKPLDTHDSIAYYSKAFSDLRLPLPASANTAELLPSEVLAMYSFLDPISKQLGSLSAPVPTERLLTTSLLALIDNDDLARLSTSTPVALLPEDAASVDLYTLSESFKAFRMRLASGAGRNERLQKRAEMLTTTVLSMGLPALMPPLNFTVEYDKSAMPIISLPNITVPTGYLPSNGYYSRHSLKNIAYNLGSRNSMTSVPLDSMGFDQTSHALLSKMASGGDKRKTFYPLTMSSFPGMGVASIKIDSNMTLDDGLDIISQITSRSKFYLPAEMRSEYFLTHVATLVSSFAVILFAPAGTGKPTPDNLAAFSTVIGTGSPYGVSYASLTRDCLIRGPLGIYSAPLNREGSLYLAMLATHPVPTQVAADATFDFYGYRQYTGDPSLDQWSRMILPVMLYDERGKLTDQPDPSAAFIEHLAIGEPYLNFCLLPPSNATHFVSLFFDRRAIYLNDQLVGELTPALPPASATVPSWDSKLKLASWGGVSSHINLDYYGYIPASVGDMTSDTIEILAATSASRAENVAASKRASTPSSLGALAGALSEGTSAMTKEMAGLSAMEVSPGNQDPQGDKRDAPSKGNSRRAKKQKK